MDVWVVDRSPNSSLSEYSPPHRLGLRGRLDDLDCNHIAITVPSEHTGKVAYERGHMVLNLHMTS